MNPISVYNDLKETYKRYIVTRYPLGKTNKYLRDKFYNLFDNHAEEILFRGPILEITPPYRPGCSLKDMGEFWYPLLDHLEKNGHQNLVERKLYRHQELALRASMDGNFIVATGTGSGKTESFLYPIINFCLKHRSNGVQALLIYPLNALIEDQIERLKVLLNGSDVTFGKYTGQTPNTLREAREDEQLNAKECPNFLIDRHSMRKEPPNILITNYTMLEYMLLRPWDNAIICNCDLNSYKFIVLDEAHSYNGTQGAEVAYLLRRLRSRLNKKADEICYIATSATLGGGVNSAEQTVEFASALFGSAFTKDALITGIKFSASEHLPGISEENLQFEDLLKWIEPDLNNLTENVYQNFGIQNLSCVNSEEFSEDLQYQVYEKLKSCHWVRKIVDFLEDNQANPVSNIAQKIFCNIEATDFDKQQALINLVAWADFARDRKSKLALIPARYHLFISATKGAYAELTNEPQKIKNLSFTQTGISSKNKYPFEIGTCRVCGEAYITGIILNDGNTRKYKPVSDSFFVAMESRERNAEKVIFSINKHEEDAVSVQVCTICGVLNNQCNHNDSVELFSKGDFVSIDIDSDIVPDEDDDVSEDNDNETIQTENKSKQKVVCQCKAILKNCLLVLRLSENGSIAPLVSTIFNHVPAMHEKDIENISSELECDESPIISKGRKLIIFSDSRQKAAYFGPYMQVSHNQLLINKFLIDEVRELTEPIVIKNFIEDSTSIFQQTESKSLLLNSLRPTDKFRDETIAANPKKVRQRLTQALIGLVDRTGLSRAGLEGLGIAAIALLDKEILQKIQLNEFCNDENAKFALIQIILQNIRYNGLFLTIFENKKVNINQDDTYFDLVPKNLFKTESNKVTAKGERVKSILGKFKANSFQIFFKTALESLSGKLIDQSQADNILISIMAVLISRNTEIVKNDKGQYQLNIEKLYIIPVDIKTGLFQKDIPGGYKNSKVCKKCGRLSWIDLNGLCNFVGCGGEVEDDQLSLQLNPDYNHYRNLYLANKQFNDLRAVEHTAQLDKMTAAKDYQREFKQGRLNILSCSTTFEMGVDLGDLSLVFMRNMPPGAANYVQRAGRAGRRPGVSPMVITYCRNLPHDQYFFKNYNTMVNGKVEPPVITLTNEKILFRHINAVFFAEFIKQNSSCFKERVDRQKDLKLKHFFENKSKDNFNGIVPAEFFGTIWFEKNNKTVNLLDIFQSQITKEFDFVKRSIKKYFDDSFLFKNARYGLEQRVKNYLDEMKFYNEKKEEFKQKEDDKKLGGYKKLIDKLQKEQLISFLSSRGILPSYAFPNAVVPLKIIDLSDGSTAVDLTRNLDQAISEYAPFASVVANSTIYTSGALTKFKSQKFTEYKYFKCPSCSFYVCCKNELGTEELKSEISNHLKNYHIDEHIKPNPKNAIFPEWGFSVPKGYEGKSIKTSTRLEKNGFASELCIDDRAFNSRELKTIKLNTGEILLNYADGYDVFRINSGKNKMNLELNGFKICKSCGMSLNENGKHKTPYDFDCSDSINVANNTSLISVMDTDVLKIKFIDIQIDNISNDDIHSFWLTVLYTFIEASARKLSIPRNELDGIYKIENDNRTAEIYILDSVPGGAGHVGRIYYDSGDKIMKDLILESINILNCTNCAEDSACYSCLFHQSNQKNQHLLNRGLALKWFERISLSTV